MTQTKSAAPTERTRVRRIAENANYEADILHAILDAAYVCHVAFNDGTSTHCIPTACWRQGGHLYIHGSNGGRLLKLLSRGTQACVTVTHVDGLVLARSAFNHSMNYRSAMVYGQFEKVGDEQEKRASLALFMDKISLGRQAQIRPGNEKEFSATTVMRIPLTEAACKVRTGGPQDDAEDMDIQVWAGVLPLETRRAKPLADTACTVAAPEYVAQWEGT